jgi:hypothetical protein
MGPRQNSQRASPYVSHPTPVTPRRSHHVADPTGVLSERSVTYANSVHLALCQRRSLHRVRSLEESQLSHILNTGRLFPLACCQSPAKESAVYHILFTSTGSELAGGSDEMLFRHPRRPQLSSCIAEGNRDISRPSPRAKNGTPTKRSLEHAARETYRTAIALAVKLYFRHRGFNHVSAVAEADAAKDKDSVAESQCWGSKVA